MAGTWLDWTIVLIGCVVLLPKLLAYLVNSSLIGILQRYAARFGLHLSCELGSLSLRQLGDFSLRVGRWRLPQHPNLFAAAEVHIGAIGLQLFRKKPITIMVQGARITMILEGATKEEREKEAAAQQQAAAAAAENPTVTPPIAPSPAPPPSSPASPSPPSSSTRTPSPLLPSISSTHLAAAAESLQASMVSATAAAATGPPVGWWNNLTHWLVLKLSEWLCVSLHDCELAVRKGDVQLSICDLGLNIWCGDGSLHSSRQMHVDLLGLAVRMEQISNQTRYRKDPAYRSEHPQWRMPPLLNIRPMEVAVDMQIQQCIPVSLESLDIQCEGIELTADPTLQLRALERAALELKEQIQALTCHLPKTPGGGERNKSTAAPSSSEAASSSSATASPSTPPSPPSLCEDVEFRLQQRQFFLRFLPKQTKLSLRHIKMELVRRDESGVVDPILLDDDEVVGERSGAGAIRRRRGVPVPAFADNSAISSSSFSPSPLPPSPHSTSSYPLPPPPILHSVICTLSKLSLLTSLKTTYPVLDLFGVATPSEDNHVSSIDWSLNMSGPTIETSQQGKGGLRLDVEYCKLTGHSSPNFAQSAAQQYTPSAGSSSKGSKFPVNSLLQASTGAPFTSPLSSHLANMSPPSTRPPLSSLKRTHGKSKSNLFHSPPFSDRNPSHPLHRQHPVLSLFHPTNAYRPQTMHALTMVIVSLRVQDFPSTAEWTRYVLRVAKRVGQFVEALPLQKPQVEQRGDRHEAAVSDGPAASPRDPAASPLRPSTSTPSPSSSTLPRPPYPSPRVAAPSAPDVNSPDAYLRQLIVPNTQWNGASTPNSTGTPALSFPSAVTLSSIREGASTSGSNGPFAHGQPPTIVPPSFSPTFSSSSSSSTSSPSFSTPADDPYLVQSAFTLNFKVVDLHLAIYKQTFDPLPLLHLSISEVAVRLQYKPPTLQTQGGPGSHSGEGRSKPHAPDRPVLLPPSERMEVVLSGLVGSMPQEAFNPHALSFHPHESLQVPGRFFQLNTATLIMDKSSADMLFHADGLTIRWCVEVLLMGPTIIDLMLAHVPPEMITPPAATSTTSPPDLPHSQHTPEKPVDLRFVKGTVTNLTVDFPYLFEFQSDDAAQSNLHGHKREASDVSSHEGASPTTPGTAHSDILSPPQPADRRLNRNTIPVVEEEGSGEAKQPPPSFSRTTSSPPSLSRPSSDTFDVGPDPDLVGGYAFGSLQSRPTSLFTYKASIANLDVDIPGHAWSLLLYQSDCLSEGDSFLTLVQASLSGNEANAIKPKGMAVTADQIHVSWRPALQLGLFKLVKDNVAAAINFKYGLCRVIPAWRKMCFPEEAEEEEEQKLGEEVMAAAVAMEAATRTLGVDYTSDPMLHLLASKSMFVTSFRQWYHHLRAKHLPEPFMHVQLHATNLLVDAALNRQETLGCTIKVDTFSSAFIPHHFAFGGVEIDFMKKPIVSVKEVNLQRVGLPDMQEYLRKVKEAESAATAAGQSASSSLPPLPPHPLLAFSEEHNLLSDYLDLSLSIREVRVEIAPALDIGSVLDLVQLKVQALVKAILDLPTLNQLSRRTKGPGYVGPPTKPPPSLVLQIEQCRFEVVDEPFDSWLQHLHLLWLDERAEQERRRALLRLRIDKLRKEGHLPKTSPSTTPPAGSPGSTNVDEDCSARECMMYEQLSEYNSRSYFARVEALKKTFSGSDSLKKAPLLNLTIASMRVSAGMEGRYGSFHQPENVLRVIRMRKAEERDGWNQMAKRRQKQEEAEAGDGEAEQPYEDSISASRSGSRGHHHQQQEEDGLMYPGSSPLLSSFSAAAVNDIPDILLSPPSSSPTSPLPLSTLAGGARLGFLAGRYFQCSLNEIKVKLRNFPLPLFECAEASLQGHTALVQVIKAPSGSGGADGLHTPVHRDSMFETPPGPPPRVPRPSPSRASRPTSEPLHPSQLPLHTRSMSSFHPPPVSTPPRPVRTSVSIGGVHSVKVDTKYRPFQLFYDIEGGMQQATAAFSPCFLYTLRDVVDALDRVVPPLPELYPIQPIPDMIGLGGLGLAAARKNRRNAQGSRASPHQTPQPEVDSPTVSAPPSSAGSSPYATNSTSATAPHQEITPVNYLHLFRGIAHGKLKLSVRDTEVKLLASNDPYESSKYLRVCAGLCDVSFEKSIFKVQVEQISALQLPAKPKQPFLMELPQIEMHATLMWMCKDIPIGTNRVGGCDVHGQQAQNTGEAAAAASSLATAGVTIPSLWGRRMPPRAGGSNAPMPPTLANQAIQMSPAEPSCACDTQHVCNMHISLSVYLSSHHPHPGALSVTLQSGSLASLVQLARVYSAIPPLPFPRRTHITKTDASRPHLLVKPLSEILRERQYPLVVQTHHTPLQTPSHTPRQHSMGWDRTWSDEMTPPHSSSSSMRRSSQGSHGSASDLLRPPPTPALSRETSLTISASPQPLALWPSKLQCVQLSGVYLERLLLEKLHVTIWEGSGLGPARGLRLGIDHVYLALELQEEAGIKTIPQHANLKGNKLYFPFKKVAYDHHLGLLRAHHLNEAEAGPSAAATPLASAAAGIAPSPLSSPAHLSPSVIVWSLSNLVFGVSKLQGLIMYNDRWRELAAVESEAKQRMNSIFGGSRVVVCTYENQRYTLGKGWSAKNLLPTDRPSWSNAGGTHRLLREEVKLPSEDWEWVTDWHRDFQLRRSGEVDEEGWEYGFDFPSRKFSRVRTWYCNVRRRRWIRVRQLKAQAGGEKSSTPIVTESGSGVVSPGTGVASELSDVSPTGLTGSELTSPSAARRAALAKKRAKKKEQEENFVLSVLRISCQQKQQQHSSDLDMLILDRERALFRLITAPIFSKREREKKKMFPVADEAAAAAAVAGTLPLPSAVQLEAFNFSHGRSQSSSQISPEASACVPTSLLNHFHIPRGSSASAAAGSSLESSLVGGSHLGSPLPPAGVCASSVYNVHHLPESDFAEAQHSHDQLKLLHATTSSIVTVGAGLGMNPSLQPLTDDDDEKEDQGRLDSEEDEEEARGSLNDRYGSRQSTSSRNKGVRFHDECVVDAVRADRRRRSKQESVSSSSTSIPSSSSFLPRTLTRSPLLGTHSLRLCDAKLLLTTEIRSTLVTLVDQYVATIMELVQQHKETQAKHKYDKQGQLLTPTPGWDEDPKSKSSNASTLSGVREEGDENDDQMSALPSYRTSSPSLESNLYGDMERGGTSSSDSTPSPLGSPRSVFAGDQLPGSSESSVRQLDPLRSLSSTPAVDSGMDDLLRRTADERPTPVFEASPDQLSPLPPNSRSQASPSPAEANSAADCGPLFTSLSASSSAAAPPPAAHPAVESEVHELFLLEVLNPQILVHSEETQGRILFMTHKVSLHGRVHFKNGTLPAAATNTTATAAGQIGQEAPVQSPSHSAGAVPPWSSPPTSSPPHQSPLSTPPPLTSRLDKLDVIAVIDQQHAFVAPTDVDVNAGIIWMEPSTAGIFKSIMQPAYFMATLALRPDLPLIATSEAKEEEEVREEVKEEEKSTRFSCRRRCSMSATVPSATTTTTSAPATAPSAPLSKAQQYLAQQPSFPSTSPHSPSHSLLHAPSFPELHSFDLKLPALVLEMDSYQFALFLDVLKTMTSPLPIQAIHHSMGMADMEEEMDAAEEVEALCTLAEIKTKARMLRKQLTGLEWEMRHVEWILSGTSQPIHNGNRRGSTSVSTSQGSSNSSSSSSSSLAPPDPLDVREEDLLSPLPGSASFTSWLITTTTRLQSYQSREDGTEDIMSRFHDLWRDHARISAQFLRTMLSLRIRQIRIKPQTAIHNIRVSALLHKVAFDMVKQEKTFLSVYVEGIQLDASLYDDASADFSVEVGSFGARNCTASYLNPQNKEYAWAEMVQPLITADREDGSVDPLVASSSSPPLDPADENHNGDIMVSLHCLKREEMEPNSKQVMVVIQHLELNLFPLQVKATYDTLSALTDYFVRDQEKFKSHRQITGTEEEIPSAVIKSQKKHAKIKSKFLPTGGHILAQEQALAQANSSSSSLTGAGREGRRGSTSLSSGRGLLDALKHSRVVSVAKEIYHGTHGQTASNNNGGGAQHELYDDEPYSASGMSTTQARQGGGGGGGGGGTGGWADEDSENSHLGLSSPSSGSSSLVDRLSYVDPKRHEKDALSAKKKSSTRLYHFVYVRIGSTLVNVSYWGSNKQSNVEDFQGLKIKFKQVLIQKKKWTINKFASQLKKEMIRNLLGQVSSTLGGFLSYKLGFRPAQDAAPLAIDDSKTKGKGGNGDSEEEATARAGYPESSSSGSGVPSHWDHATSSSSHPSLPADESAAKRSALLFGGKKSTPKKLVESMKAILPGLKDKEKERERERELEKARSRSRDRERSFLAAEEHASASASRRGSVSAGSGPASSNRSLARDASPVSLRSRSPSRVEAVDSYTVLQTVPSQSSASLSVSALPARPAPAPASVAMTTSLSPPSASATPVPPPIPPRPTLPPRPSHILVKTHLQSAATTATTAAADPAPAAHTQSSSESELP